MGEGRQVVMWRRISVGRRWRLGGRASRFGRLSARWDGLNQNGAVSRCGVSSCSGLWFWVGIYQTAKSNQNARPFPAAGEPHLSLRAIAHARPATVGDVVRLTRTGPLGQRQRSLLRSRSAPRSPRKPPTLECQTDHRRCPHRGRTGPLPTRPPTPIGLAGTPSWHAMLSDCVGGIRSLRSREVSRSKQLPVP